MFLNCDQWPVYNQGYYITVSTKFVDTVIYPCISDAISKGEDVALFMYSIFVSFVYI